MRVEALAAAPYGESTVITNHGTWITALALLVFLGALLLRTRRGLVVPPPKPKPSPPVTLGFISYLIVVVLLYSPIAFPIEQFPDWLAAVHEVLPLYHMGVVVRAGLTEGLVGDVGTSYAVVAAWTAAGRRTETAAGPEAE